MPTHLDSDPLSFCSSNNGPCSGRYQESGDGQHMILPLKGRQKYKLLLHCGNIGGQRRLHEGKERIQGAFLAKDLLFCA